MKPYLFVPFLREALEKTFEDAPFVAVYPTKTYLVAQAGGLRRLKVVVKSAPEGKFSGHLLLHHLSRGYGLFLVHPDLLEGLLVLYTKPLPFSRTPYELDWPTLNLAAVSKVYLPMYVLEGGEGP
jgi:hypothetical protein